jgi:hypothetical protein
VSREMDEKDIQSVRDVMSQVIDFVDKSVDIPKMCQNGVGTE